MYAAAYARYSTTSQTELSIAAQLKGIREYCAREKIALLPEPYIDEARSGTNISRAGYQRLLADARRGVFEAVVIYDVSRGSRDVGDWFAFRKEMAALRVRVLSVTNRLGEPDDPDTFLGELLAVGLGQHRVMEDRRKSIAGKTIRAERGLFCGGYAPLGYDIDRDTGKYVINEREAEAVRTAFTMYADGHSYNEIVAAIKALGVVGKRGAPIGANTLHYLFKNRRYMGQYIWFEYEERHMHKQVGKKTDNPIIIDGGIPAIVDVKTWNAVALRMQGNRGKYKGGGERRVYLLTSIIRCGLCGAPLHGQTVTARGHIYAKYVCSRRMKFGKSTCDCPLISCYQIDSYILDMLAEYLVSDAMLARVRDQLMAQARLDGSDRRDAIQGQLNGIDTKVANLMKYLEDGTATDIILQRLRQLQDQKTALTLQMRALPTATDIPAPEEIIDVLREDVGRLFTDRTNIQLLASIVRKYVPAVTIHPDRIDITISSISLFNMHKKNQLTFNLLTGNTGSPGADYVLLKISVPFCDIA